MFEFILYDMLREKGPSRSDMYRITDTAINPIESRLDHLELACAGLWKILKDGHGYTDEELVAAIQEVDARDGRVDGKIGPTPGQGTCPNCRRKLISRSSPKCSWCGAAVAHKPF